VREQLAAVCERRGLSRRLTERVTLAASEACTNVVVHAYDGIATGPMYITAVAEPNQFRLSVRDQGVGSHPKPDSPGLGLGVPLIATVADEVEVKSGNSGSEICMTFSRRVYPADSAGLQAPGGRRNPATRRTR
jgi:anti-sigma regulatory factor (Ser/Thr protein kinase)